MRAAYSASCRSSRSGERPCDGTLLRRLPTLSRKHVLLGQPITHAPTGNRIQQACTWSAKATAYASFDDEAGIVHQLDRREAIKKSQVSSIEDTCFLILKPASQQQGKQDGCMSHIRQRDDYRGPLGYLTCKPNEYIQGLNKMFQNIQA